MLNLMSNAFEVWEDGAYNFEYVDYIPMLQI